MTTHRSETRRGARATAALHILAEQLSYYTAERAAVPAAEYDPPLFDGRDRAV